MAMRAVSRKAILAGRIVTGIVTLFMIFDGVSKVVKEVHARVGTVELGFSESLVAPIGVILLICTALYAIPRTSVLGGILLTGYLGGAVATQMRVGHPLFQCIFPAIFGGLVWLGPFLREPKLRELVPLKAVRHDEI